MRHPMHRRAMLSLVLALLAPTATLAQQQAVRTAQPSSPTHERIQARTYSFAEAGRDMPYEVYVPTSYNASRPTPLIIALHGLGSNPTQVIRYQGLTDLAEERGYIVAAPMGYNEGGWYGSRGPGAGLGGRGGRGGGEPPPENLGELSEKDVMNVLSMMREEFNVDPNRIYVFGHSMGGAGGWYLGIKNPDLFAALALAAPAAQVAPAISVNDLEKIRHVPVIVVQGDADDLVPVDVTRQWVARMRELNMTHRYIEIPGGDHTTIISRSPENMRAIFDFFDSARRR